MALTLFDTLTNRKKPFETGEPGLAKVYICGPTTYDDAHIGHARPCVVYDVLVRHLRAEGTRVHYVRNVTDIDDKIIVRARDNGEEPAALAARMLASYQTDMARLHTIEPDEQPKVSEHMDEIRGLIEKLVERGHAYVSAGDVYFHVGSFADYGKLSHRNLAQMEAGASERVDESDAQKKKHPYDFALWKAAKPGEPSWESPWGPGRPGWHIECSAMSMRYLGETFDLHGGGLDLVFPHHENEIAQSECATGHTYCRQWMHNGFVQVNKEKMSKSLGNFFRLREAFERTEPESLRYSLLAVHYRAPYNLEMDLDDAGNLLGFPQFRDAEARLVYLYTTRERLQALPESKRKADESAVAEDIAAFSARLTESLDDDMNTAQGIGHVANLLRATNELLDKANVKKGYVPEHAYRAALAAFDRVGLVLGLGLDDARAFLTRVRDRRATELGIAGSWVEQKIAERAEARAQKDFTRADEIRVELTTRGVEILDSPDGTTWRLL